MTTEGALTRVASRALIAITSIFAIALAIHFQVRPRQMVGDQVTLHFSKSVFINCLSEPTEVIQIRKVGPTGIRVEAISMRLENSFASAEWAAGCVAVGIKPDTKGTRSYFIPFSVIATIQSEGSRSWWNPIAV